MKKTIIALSLCTLSATVMAKDLYVNNSAANCSDAITYAANNASNPWCTLQRAASGADGWSNRIESEAAQAGDTVYVNEGSYTTTGTSSRLHPAYLPVNSGNATDGYITFEAVGNVRLNLTPGTEGTVIGSYMRNYIKWAGFLIDESTAPYHPDTGVITVFSSDNVIIENCVVRAMPSAIQDNHNALRLEDSSNVVVRGNVLYGVTGATAATSTTHNYAGIMLYGNNDIIIENNHIFDSNSGIHVKGNNNYNFTIRNNLIHNTVKAIRTSYTDTQGMSYVYQNVIRDGVGSNNMAINIAESSNNIIFANNTIDNVDNGIYFSSSSGQNNLSIRNNIITNTATAVNAWTVSAKTFSINHNVYFNTSQWAYLGNTQSSITSWKSAVGDDANADEHDPQYMDPAGTDFRLGSGSSSINFGVDFLDLDNDANSTEFVNAGAYTSPGDFVGSPLGASIPSNPTNLRRVQ